MKKLIAMMAAVCAIGAYAGDWSGAETVGFDSEEVGPWTVPEEGWSTKGTAEDFDLQIVKKTEGDNFLQVETPKDGSLAKTINAEQTGYNVYVDAQVKFTPFDQAPTIDTDAKIAVWYLAQDAEGEPDTEGYKAGQTNLMVTAGVLDPDGKVTQTNIALDVANFDPNEWHQLKIESKGGIVTPAGVEELIPNRLGFTITLDNNEVAATKTFLTSGEAYLTADAKALGTKLFPSLGTELKVSALALQGSGSIDDITIDATEVAVEIPVVLTVLEGEGYTVSANPAQAFPGDQITITYTIEPGYAFAAGAQTEFTGKLLEDGTVEGAAEAKPTASLVVAAAIIGGESVEYTASTIGYFFAIVAENSDPAEIEFIAEVTYNEFVFEKGTVLVIKGAAAVTADGIALKDKDAFVTDENGDQFTAVFADCEGYKLADPVEDEVYGGTKYTLVLDEEPATYLAEINDKGYETLAEAVAAAENDQTVKLLDDCTGDGIMIDKSITIDFNGKTYTVDASLVGSPSTQSQAFNLKRYNTITLKNGTITSSVARMLVQNYSSLTLDNMILDGENLAAKNGKGNDYTAYTLSNCAGETVIKGGTVIKARVLADQKSFAFDTYYMAGTYEDAAVTVNDATITGDIELAGGDLTLTAGTLTGKLVAGSNIEKGVITKADAFEAAAPEGYEWDKEGKLVEKSEDPQIVPEEQGTVVIEGKGENAVAKVTPKEGVTEIAVTPPVDFMGKYEIPVSITKITGVEINQLIIKSGDFDIAPACKLVEGGAIELDSEATVTVGTEQIPVQPTLTEATDEVKPLAVGATTEVGVKAIPGLTYSLVRSETIGGKQATVASEQATTARVTLTDEFVGGKPASAFYVIQVTK